MDVARSTAAAIAIASSLGLAAEGSVVLHSSNKLTVRLLPCDVVARVSPGPRKAAQFEVDLALQLFATGFPVAALEPRAEPQVYQRDDLMITFWTYYPTISAEIAPDDYASSLENLHAGMRAIDVPTPHFIDRVEEALLIVSDREQSPGLSEVDRAFLAQALIELRRDVEGRGAEQLLHGEPHAGNVLNTANGPVFVDLETCCRGPVEFDLAHAPVEVADYYPDVDRELLATCRVLVLAMITAWRWDRDDQLPNGRQLAVEWLDQLRARLATD